MILRTYPVTVSASLIFLATSCLDDRQKVGQIDGSGGTGGASTQLISKGGLGGITGGQPSTSTTAALGGATMAGGAGGAGGTTAASGGMVSTGGATTEASGGRLPTGGSNAAGGNSPDLSGGSTANSTGGQSSLPTCGTRHTTTIALEAPAGVTVPTVLEMFSNKSLTSQGSLEKVVEANGSVRLEIVTSQGDTWAVVLHPNWGLDTWVQDLSLAQGHGVTLDYRLARSFQFGLSTGFVLKDKTGLLMAVEAGPWAMTLNAVDIAPLTMSNGNALCSRLVACTDAYFTHTEMVVKGDYTANVGLDADGEVMLTGERYGIRNSGAGNLLPTMCSDVEMAPTWAIWRKTSSDAG
jgi:hypothetical protein